MVLAVTKDLMVTSPAANAARQAGLPFQTVSPEAILTAQWDAVPTLVLLDLNATSDIAEVVANLREKAAAAPIIAFGPHVQEAKLQAAKEAGCTRVLTRGQFHSGVAELVADAANAL